jgi:hypothetical protein
MSLDHCEKINVAYVSPTLKRRSSQKDSTGKELHYGVVGTLLEKEAVLDFDLLNSSSALFFHQLFIENKANSETATEAVKVFDLSGNDMPGLIDDIASFRREFEVLEYRPVSLPPYM